MSAPSEIEFGAVELHAPRDPALIRKYGAAIKALGGRYSLVHGYTRHRYMTIPIRTPEGRVVADRLLCENRVSCGITRNITGVDGDAYGLQVVVELPRSLADIERAFRERVRAMLARGAVRPKTIYTEDEKRDQRIAELTRWIAEAEERIGKLRAELREVAK